MAILLLHLCGSEDVREKIGKPIDTDPACRLKTDPMAKDLMTPPIQYLVPVRSHRGDGPTRMLWLVGLRCLSLPLLVLHLAVTSTNSLSGGEFISGDPQLFSVQGMLHEELHEPFEPSLSRKYAFQFVQEDGRWETFIRPILWSGRGSRIVEGRQFGEARPEFIQARFDGTSLYYVYSVSTNMLGSESLLNVANALWTRRAAPIGTDDLVMGLWYTYGSQSYLTTNQSCFAYPLTAGAGDSLLEPVLLPVRTEPTNAPVSQLRSITTFHYSQDSSDVRTATNRSTTNSLLEVMEIGQWGKLNMAKRTRIRHYFKLGDRTPMLRSEILITSTNTMSSGAVPEDAPTLPGMSWIRVYGYFGDENGPLNFTLLTNTWPTLLDVRTAQSSYHGR